MKRHSILKFIMIISCFVSSFSMWSQESQSPENLSPVISDSLTRKFLKGNVMEKKACMEEAAAGRNYEVVLLSIDWCNSMKEVLSDDPDVEDLLVESIKVLSPVTADASTEKVSNSLISARLRETFNIFSNNDVVRINILEKLALFPSAENTAFVNEFFMDSFMSEKKFGEVLLADIIAMEALGDMNSFRNLFTAYMSGMWDDYSMILQVAFTFISQRYEDEVIALLQEYSDANQLAVVEILSKNLKMSEKIRLEVAENVLANSINNVGEMKELSQLTSSDIEIQLMAFDTLTTVEWQKDLVTVQDFFNVTRTEYAVGLIDDSSFAGVITKVAGVADPETAAELSAYLDFLNRSMEQENAPVEAVVLSVINALGELGDKVAFDSLLCVIYLDYSDEVIEAAKVALAKLKW